MRLISGCSCYNNYLLAAYSVYISPCAFIPRVPLLHAGTTAVNSEYVDAKKQLEDNDTYTQVSGELNAQIQSLKIL